mmetsp:Transcript_17952/g.29416  ORF Transcript_17952/g.29416 Transcript_17952/m.29416 type:complete len:265 (+) Transcript_17952:1779-2573(+)
MILVRQTSSSVRRIKIRLLQIWRTARKVAGSTLPIERLYHQSSHLLKGSAKGNKTWAEVLSWGRVPIMLVTQSQGHSQPLLEKQMKNGKHGRKDRLLYQIFSREQKKSNRRGHVGFLRHFQTFSRASRQSDGGQLMIHTDLEINRLLDQRQQAQEDLMTPSMLGTHFIHTNVLARGATDRRCRLSQLRLQRPDHTTLHKVHRHAPERQFSQGRRNRTSQLSLHHGSMIRQICRRHQKVLAKTVENSTSKMGQISLSLLLGRKCG